MDMHIFFNDTAVASADNGQMSSVTRTYFDHNVFLDVRSARDLPITEVPLPTTGVSLISDTAIADSGIQQALFTRIERVMYMSDQLTLGALEIEFGNETEFTYVDASLSLAPTVAVTSALFDSAIAINMPQGFSFSAAIDGTDYDIYVWFNNAYMVANYDGLEFTAIVPPMNLTDLYAQATATATALPLATASTISSYIASQISAIIAAQDNTGISSVNVKYYTDVENGVYVTIPFTVVYRGRTPGTIDMYTAIQSHLLNSGVGTETGWTERLPELFIAGSFYIVPFWDNTHTTADRTINRSAIKETVAVSNMTTTLFDMTASMPDAIFLSTSYDSILVGMIPDVNNDVDNRDFLEFHPSYQDYASSEANFRYMEAATQTFTNLLVRALAVAAGETTDTAFNEVVMDTRTFISFTVSGHSFMVLTKETYTNLIGG